MNKSFLSAIIILLFSTGIKAQINLVGVANNLQTGDFKLYPNPVSETLTIDYPSSGKVTVQIISSCGKPIFVQDFESGNKMELNLASLVPGVYVVNLTSERKTSAKKILVP